MSLRRKWLTYHLLSDDVFWALKWRGLYAISKIEKAIRRAYLVMIPLLMVWSVTGASGERFPFAITDQGQVLGEVKGQITSFKGVPYASRSSTGKPEAPERRADILIADHYGAGCARAKSEEPCYLLNIFRPTEFTGYLPIILWVGPRRLIQPEDYELLRIVREQVIFVTLSSEEPSVAKASATDLVADDLVAAIGWMKENISAFGGDAENITTVKEEEQGCAVVGSLSLLEQEQLMTHVLDEVGALFEDEPDRCKRNRDARKQTGTSHLIGATKAPRRPGP